MILTYLLTLSLLFSDPDPSYVYKLVGFEQESLKKAVYSTPQLLRAVPVDYKGQVVGDTLNILIQHRKHPAERVSNLHRDADVIIACWPSRIPQTKARRKAVMNDYSGRIMIRYFKDFVMYRKIPNNGGTI